MAPRNTRTSNNQDSLMTNDSGAIMIVGVFMAMLVTGFLYYIIGIGNTLIYRERMQDAADAIAFSGAVVYARGMNLIALINIIMALLVSILFALRIIQWALYGAALLALAAIVTAPLAPAIYEAGDAVRNIADTYQRVIVEPALRLGHSAQAAIRVSWPLLAQGRVVASTLSGTYQPPVTSGMLVPIVPRSLPVKAVGIRSTCTHAAEPIARLLTWPLTLVPGGRIMGLVTRVLRSALVSLQVWAFCPRDESSMRPHEIDPGDASCNDGMPGQNCEYVQIRGVVLGNPPFAGNERGVAVAAWGHANSGDLLGSIGNLSRVGLAQAEYYYEGDEPRDEWTWHMYWRARFRRFTMPSNPLGIGALGGLDLSLINRVIVH